MCISGQTKVFLSISPVTKARVHMQEKVDTSKFILCRLAENSTMLSIHSPKPRKHWSRSHTDPSQKISFPSSRLDLKQYDSLCSNFSPHNDSDKSSFHKFPCPFGASPAVNPSFISAKSAAKTNPFPSFVVFIGRSISKHIYMLWTDC